MFSFSIEPLFLVLAALFLGSHTFFSWVILDTIHLIHEENRNQTSILLNIQMELAHHNTVEAQRLARELEA